MLLAWLTKDIVQSAAYNWAFKTYIRNIASHCQVWVIYCTEDTQSSITWCIWSVMCGQPVSQSLFIESKRCRATDCVRSVIQGSLHLHLSHVIICASKRHARLAWQATYIHLRHKRPPCLRYWIHKLKALFRKREMKEREACGSVCEAERKNEEARRIEFLWHWIYILISQATYLHITESVRTSVSFNSLLSMLS